MTAEMQAFSTQALKEWEWTVPQNGILAWVLLQSKRAKQKEIKAHKWMNTSEKTGTIIQY